MNDLYLVNYRLSDIEPLKSIMRLSKEEKFFVAYNSTKNQTVRTKPIFAKNQIPYNQNQISP